MNPLEPVAPRWISYEKLQEINEAGAFQPLSELTSRRIEEEVEREFADDCIDRHACIVTDEWVFGRDACRVAVEELPLAAMRRVLAPRAWATVPIRAYYDCGLLDRRLSGMLLSPRGLTQEEDGMKVWVSREALQYLRVMNARLLASDDADIELAPPRFAIADYFVAGTFDEIDEATLIERQAVGLVQTRGLVKVVYGGPGNVLQSHLLSWDNRNATIASRVPSVPTRSDFRVVLAGPMTTQQELAIAKQHECDGARVQVLQALLRRINPLYESVTENPEFHGVNHPHEVYCTRLGDSDAGGLVAQARERQQTVAGVRDVGSAAEIDERTLLETETVVVETSVDDDDDACLSHALNTIMGRPTFVAQHSTSILQYNDPSYLERVYPHLLTFGIGGFSNARSHRYSKRAIVLHYLHLSSNRFAEDPLFKIQMFDYLATERVKTGVFIRVRHDPDVATRAMHVSSVELRSAMEVRAARRHATQTEKPAPQSSSNGRAGSLLKAINASSAKVSSAK